MQAQSAVILLQKRRNEARSALGGLALEERARCACRLGGAAVPLLEI
jgi:hypothetical protein